MDTAVVLKAGMVPLTTLLFNSNNLAAIEKELNKKSSEAPALFKHLPCALDLSTLLPHQINLSALLELCRSTGLLPMAVRNASQEWLPILAELELANLGRSHKTQSHQEGKPAGIIGARIYQGNVRSGQQLYHDGDLIIFGTVSNGAEVLTSGDLHIYGTLRGRALAGVKGNEKAVIVCQQFDPELVAIAGQYKVFEESMGQQTNVYVQLQDGSLNITQV
ncbi:MAG: septum site-determining protein MinC [Venatoribacter sp.]